MYGGLEKAEYGTFRYVRRGENAATTASRKHSAAVIITREMPILRVARGTPKWVLRKSAGTLYSGWLPHQEHTDMTAPSRGFEIRRRRARKDKIQKLRLRYRKATTTSDKDAIFDKVKSLSPTITREQFEAPLQKKSS